MLPDGFRRAFRLALGRRPIDRDIDDEIAFHLAMREEKLRASGLTEAEARTAARRRFGDVRDVADRCRSIDSAGERRRRRAELAESLWQDVRYAARALARTPAFTGASLLTLALGIGATTAIFSVVYGVLLRPLPYAEPERLVQLWETSTRTPGDRNPVSVPNYLDWAAGMRSFAGSVAYAFNRYTLAGDGTPEQIQGAQILGDVGAVLGVRPLLGRTIGAGDARAYVAVLGEPLWRRRYGADPSVVGRAIRMNGVPYTVVGVMPAAFRFPRPDVELWTGYATILGDPAWGEARGRRFQRVVARLAPGVTPEAAGAELGALAARLSAAYPVDNPGGGAVAVPLREELVGDVRPALLVLLGAVGCVLLIACANVTHLLLARTAGRERELAVRAALGAGSGRLVRQLLTESAVLAAGGGLLGVLVAFAGVAALARLDPDAIPRVEDVRVDGWALAFCAAAAALTSLLVGLVPAVRGGRHSLAASTREGARGAGTSAGRLRTQAALVVVEVAVSLVLLVGAGLLLRSFERLRTVDPGVEPAGVATMLVAASPTKYPDGDRQRALFASIVESVAALPGVQAVGLCDCLPPNQVRSSGSVQVQGGTTNPAELPVTNQIRVGANYFGALRIPTLAGRAFTDADRSDSPPVAVVNETFARRELAGGARGAGAVGRRVSFDGERWLTVVGVVADVHYRGLAAPVEPAVYVPFAQDPFPGMNLFVRAAGDPLAVVPSVRRAVLALDPELPLASVATLHDAVADATGDARFSTTLLAIFAGLAFVLAAVGIYGVVAYGVARRRHEMGVRLALGAQRGSVIRLVVRGALRPVTLGVVLGLAGAAAGARALARLLYGTSAHDPATYAGAAALLVGVAALAAYLPGRRAADADPVSALRSE